MMITDGSEKSSRSKADLFELLIAEDLTILSWEETTNAYGTW